MTVTFQGHVTASVTWSFDFPILFAYSDSFSQDAPFSYNTCIRHRQTDRQTDRRTQHCR